MHEERNILSQRETMNQPILNRSSVVNCPMRSADRLERMITSGELQPGDEMPSERVLMERFEWTPRHSRSNAIASEYGIGQHLPWRRDEGPPIDRQVDFGRST